MEIVVGAAVTAFFSVMSLIGGKFGIKLIEEKARATLQEAAERFAHSIIDQRQMRYLGAAVTPDVSDLIERGVDYIKTGNAGTIRQIGISDDRLGIYVSAAIQQAKSATLLELVGDVLWTREIIARRRISFAEQDHLLADVFRRYHVVRCRMDQTGMGEKPVEDAKRNHGEARVEGVLMSAAIKLDLATVLKEAMQDRRARIPAGDVVLRADLHAIRKQVGVTGIPRLIADTDTDGHADRFWAFALAASAAKQVYQPYDYQPVPLHGGDDCDRDIVTTGGFRAGKGLF